MSEDRVDRANATTEEPHRVVDYSSFEALFLQVRVFAAGSGLDVQCRYGAESVRIDVKRWSGAPVHVGWFSAINQ